MQLTQILCRWKKRLPKGHLWRGKYKLYRPVTPMILAKKLEEFEIEEKNMYYLRHPYLTPEQSAGHGKFFNHKEKFIEKHREVKLKWKDNNLLGDRFGFLKMADQWE